MGRCRATLLTTLFVFGSGLAAVEVAPPPRPTDVTLPLEESETVSGLCLSADNRRLFAAVTDWGAKTSEISVWDLATGKRSRFAGVDQGGDVRRLTWSGADGLLVVWQRERVTWHDPNAKPHAFTVRAEVRVERQGLRYEAWSAAGDDLVGFAHRRGSGEYAGIFIPLGDSILIVGADHDGPTVLRVPFTAPTVPARPLARPQGEVDTPSFDGETFVLSPDGVAAAACTAAADPDTHRKVWAWDVKTRALAREIKYKIGDDDAFHTHALAVSRGGWYVVTGSRHGPAHVFDARTGKELHTCWTPRQGWLEGLVCSPTADVFAVAKSRAVDVWNVRSGEKLGTWPRKNTERQQGNPVVFSPDGSRLAWGTSGAIRIVPTPVVK